MESTSSEPPYEWPEGSFFEKIHEMKYNNELWILVYGRNAPSKEEAERFYKRTIAEIKLVANCILAEQNGMVMGTMGEHISGFLDNLTRGLCWFEERYFPKEWKLSKNCGFIADITDDNLEDRRKLVVESRLFQVPIVCQTSEPSVVGRHISKKLEEDSEFSSFHNAHRFYQKFLDCAVDALYSYNIKWVIESNGLEGEIEWFKSQYPSKHIDFDDARQTRIIEENCHLKRKTEKSKKDERKEKIARFEDQKVAPAVIVRAPQKGVGSQGLPDQPLLKKRPNEEQQNKSERPVASVRAAAKITATKESAKQVQMKRAQKERSSTDERPSQSRPAAVAATNLPPGKSHRDPIPEPPLRFKPRTQPIPTIPSLRERTVNTPASLADSPTKIALQTQPIPTILSLREQKTPTKKPEQSPGTPVVTLTITSLPRGVSRAPPSEFNPNMPPPAIQTDKTRLAPGVEPFVPQSRSSIPEKSLAYKERAEKERPEKDRSSEIISATVFAENLASLPMPRRKSVLSRESPDRMGPSLAAKVVSRNPMMPPEHRSPHPTSRDPRVQLEDHRPTSMIQMLPQAVPEHTIPAFPRTLERERSSVGTHVASNNFAPHPILRRPPITEQTIPRVRDQVSEHRMVHPTIPDPRNQLEHHRSTVTIQPQLVPTITTIPIERSELQPPRPTDSRIPGLERPSFGTCAAPGNFATQPIPRRQSIPEQTLENRVPINRDVLPEHCQPTSTIQPQAVPTNPMKRPDHWPSLPRNPEDQFEHRRSTSTIRPQALPTVPTIQDQTSAHRVLHPTKPDPRDQLEHRRPISTIQPQVVPTIPTNPVERPEHWLHHPSDSRIPGLGLSTVGAHAATDNFVPQPISRIQPIPEQTSEHRLSIDRNVQPEHWQSTSTIQPQAVPTIPINPLKRPEHQLPHTRDPNGQPEHRRSTSTNQPPAVPTISTNPMERPQHRMLRSTDSSIKRPSFEPCAAPDSFALQTISRKHPISDQRIPTVEDQTSEHRILHPTKPDPRDQLEHRRPISTIQPQAVPMIPTNPMERPEHWLHHPSDSRIPGFGQPSVRSCTAPDNFASQPISRRQPILDQTIPTIEDRASELPTGPRIQAREGAPLAPQPIFQKPPIPTIRDESWRPIPSQQATSPAPSTGNQEQPKLTKLMEFAKSFRTSMDFGKVRNMLDTVKKRQSMDGLPTPPQVLPQSEEVREEAVNEAYGSYRSYDLSRVPKSSGSEQRQGSEMTDSSTHAPYQATFAPPAPSESPYIGTFAPKTACYTSYGSTASSSSSSVSALSPSLHQKKNESLLSDPVSSEDEIQITYSEVRGHRLGTKEEAQKPRSIRQKEAQRRLSMRQQEAQELRYVRQQHDAASPSSEGTSTPEYLHSQMSSSSPEDTPRSEVLGVVRPKVVENEPKRFSFKMNPRKVVQGASVFKMAFNRRREVDENDD